MARIFISGPYTSSGSELTKRAASFFTNYGHFILGAASSVTEVISSADVVIALVTEPDIRKQSRQWMEIEYAINEGRRRKEELFVLPYVVNGIQIPMLVFGAPIVFFDEKNLEATLERGYPDVLKQLKFRAERSRQEVSNNVENQNFRIGSTGDMVTKIQTLLKNQGFEVVADGVFGEQTADAVTRFQLENDLVATGEVDSTTWARLNIPPPEYLKGHEEETEQPESTRPQKKAQKKVQKQSKSEPEPDPILEQKVEEPVIQQQKTGPLTPRSILHSAAAKLHSDDSDPEDQLQYEMYAEAIASIIKDSKLSPPPLNVAIIAPWGQGKTTLMRYIKKRFPQREPLPDSPQQHLSFGMLWQWFGASSKVVRWFKRLFYSESSEQVADQLRDGMWKPQSLKHPTVWFNPWRYQSSEQIWAGLGHAMITQLVAKLDPIQREQFWLSLRLKRIDGNAIRRDIHKRLFESVLPVLIVGLMVAGLIVFVASFVRLGTAVISGAWVVSGGSFLWGLYKRLKDFASKSLEGKFATYVREPNYEEKMGLFHEINEDLSKVCNELIDKDHPAIIFIDDLDRCSPKVVTEVIEAINLMMTSDFRDRCYFVFGMDAQMVSAALDAQYSSMAGKFVDKERIHGSVGWYFLDKFIQLPFFIPVLNPSDKQSFLRRFFNTPVTVPPAVENIPTQQEVEQDASEALQDEAKLETLKQKYEGKATVLQSAMTRKLMADSKDSTDIMEEVINFAEYLDGSPRGLKRFANLLRFYHTQQQMRRYFPTSSASGSTASTKSLAKWLVINLRWPQMVRWVQWEYEEKLLYSADPEGKAKKIDELISRVEERLKDEHAYEAWLKIVDPPAEKDKPKPPNGAHLRWLMDRDLFLLLYKNRHEDSSLEKALQYDVW